MTLFLNKKKLTQNTYQQQLVCVPECFALLFYTNMHVFSSFSGNTKCHNENGRTIDDSAKSTADDDDDVLGRTE